MPKLRNDLRYSNAYPNYMYRKDIHAYPEYLYARSIHAQLPSRAYIGDVNASAWNYYRQRGWGSPKKKRKCVEPSMKGVPLVM